MKEIRMDCEKARNIDIVSTLAKSGHFPVRKTEKEAWFLSPFRTETQASFKVSLKKNYWIDFGTFEGGSTIDLVMKMENCSVREALERLSGNMDHFSFHRRPNPTKKEHRTNPIQIIEIKEIEHRALQNYLSSRSISIKTARKLCKEIHYRIGERTYFGIGLQNRSEGWELRNSYWKGSTSPKDVSLVKNDPKNLTITEGMFDMLTLMELRPEIGNSHDLLVLNTTAFVKRMIKEIGKYESVELFLDRDKAGMGMTELLLEKCPNSRDMSSLYRGFKDINEWKVKSAKDEVRQRIQDVSLSCQILLLLPKVAKDDVQMKKEFVQFRCSVYEKKLLKVKARKSGLTLSEYCRRAAFEDRIVERMTDEQIEAYKLLVKYQRNFRLITNMFRKRNPRLAEETAQLAKEIRQHLLNFKKC